MKNLNFLPRLLFSTSWIRIFLLPASYPPASISNGTFRYPPEHPVECYYPNEPVCMKFVPRAEHNASPPFITATVITVRNIFDGWLMVWSGYPGWTGFWITALWPAVQSKKEHENTDEYERSVLLFHTARICWFTIQSGSLIGRKRLSSQTFEHNGYTGKIGCWNCCG